MLSHDSISPKMLHLKYLSAYESLKQIAVEAENSLEVLLDIKYMWIRESY